MLHVEEVSLEALAAILMLLHTLILRPMVLQLSLAPSHPKVTQTYIVIYVTKKEQTQSWRLI